MKKLTELPAWQALQKHHQIISNDLMQTIFANDTNRFTNFSLELNHILLDFSKNRITSETISLLTQLAHEVNLPEKIKALFAGDSINSTEHRPALHTALRDRKNKNLTVQSRNVMNDIHTELEKMQRFTDNVRNETWKGATGKPIRHIVNIGIGGSHLGPLMVSHALKNFADPKLHCYFISNIDDTQTNEILKKIDPETTLFIISSKSFTTIETLLNANLVRTWLKNKLGNIDFSTHFVAVTAAFDKAKQWGIAESNIFNIWDWVGGRYSIWSAIGLPVAIMIGMKHFYDFLDGAHEVDLHFREMDFSKNLPVILGLLGIWYINFFACREHVIAPYAYELNYFCDYIQQADMESNGKRVTQKNTVVDYATGPVIFGQQGCDGQHSFFQLLHQGPQCIPVDFILSAEKNDSLIASALSQAQALMLGHADSEEYKIIPGNRPSNVLFLKKITPHSLGMLIALYEHKIFVQAMIWGINPFDQWGVELGKKLLPPILADLKNDTSNTAKDSSTAGLIHYYRNNVE